jgi:hypothetical protein
VKVCELCSTYISARRGAALLLFCACAAAPVRLRQPLTSGLRPLLGEWRCAGGASWSFTPDLGGAFVEQRYREKDYLLKGEIGWDEEAERLTADAAASDGTSETGSAGNWDGDELTFFGVIRDGERRVNFRRTFRTTPGGIEWRLELQQDGEFKPALHATCTRN